MTHDELESALDKHLVRIVNALRDGCRASLVSMFLGVPEWLVLRIGHDARLLSAEDCSRYLRWLDSQTPARTGAE